MSLPLLKSLKIGKRLFQKNESPDFTEIDDEASGKTFFGEDLEIKDQVLFIAEKNFGVKYLFPWQRLVIGNILDAAKDLEKHPENDGGMNDEETDGFCLGRQIVLLPTGAGKSMCFLLPSLLLDGATLVFYPLLGLMNDQERRMKESGIGCVTFRGGQSNEEREENFRRLASGAKIILANPEVLQNEALVERLKTCSISHIAIDEAHCVSEWGDSFRPAYLTLGNIIKTLEVPLVTAFTATASSTVLSRISEILFDGNAHLVRGESDRPNLHYSVKYTFSKKKTALRLSMTEQKPLLIFCGTRKNAEDMAMEIACAVGKEKVKFYHAGLSREEKKAVEDWFFPRDDAILCVTCAFGMGIDKSNIRTVIHLEASPTAESYIQEAGRGGRDKKTSKAILLWSYEDSRKYNAFPKGSRPRVLKDFAEAKSCRRQILLDALGGEKAVCSGCDICDGKRENPDFRIPDLSFSEDGKAFHRFVYRNRKYYSEEEILQKMKDTFNAMDRKIFGINVWDVNDVKEISESLKKAKILYSAGPLWKNNLTARKDFVIEDNEEVFRKQRHLRLRKRLPLPFSVRHRLQEQERERPSLP